MRIGIFGGTFDPPHTGHLILASEALYQLHLDVVLWVVAPQPPHKLEQEVSPVAQRLELVQAAIRSEPRFRISRIELDRPGPHFSVDTVEVLKQQFPDSELYFLIGGDSLRDLPEWHEPDELVDLVDGIGVMHREMNDTNLKDLEKMFPGIKKKTFFIRTPLIEISSSDLRSRLETGQNVHYYLPDPVLTIIRKKKYYLK